MSKYKLEFIVFISGAVVMIFELVGSRVLGPHLGNSIFIWTSIIGVILGSLSLGYWLGGRWADRGASYTFLALILLLAGALIGLMNLFKDQSLIFITNYIRDIRWGGLSAALLLFSWPSILLGAVSPYAVKLKINSLENSGRTVGNLYAISTLGSIVGTFAAGFWLIPFFGTSRIIYILAAVLTLLSLVSARTKNFKAKISLTTVFLLMAVLNQSFFNSQGIGDFDTQYSRVLIYDRRDQDTGRLVRFMNIDRMSSSAMFLDSDDLFFDYYKYYRLSEHFKPDIKNALLVGGAGYVYPRDFLRMFPVANMDVVEIDTKLTELARGYFALVDSDRLDIYHQDGRIFLNKNEKRYDVIFMDAFNSFYAIPFHLTTQEAVRKMYESLTDDGLVIANLISPISTKEGVFLQAAYSTYRSIFPQVYLFPTKGIQNDKIIQNVMLVAFKSSDQPSGQTDNEEYQNYLTHRWTADLYHQDLILTDEWAPVDYYTNKMLKLVNTGSR